MTLPKVTKTYRTVTLPVSVSVDHPDYTRERYTLDQASGYLHMCRDIVYRESIAMRIGHRITSQSSRATGEKARRLYSQRDLDVYRESQRQEPATGGRTAPRASADTRHVLEIPMPKVRRFM